VRLEGSSHPADGAHVAARTFTAFGDQFVGVAIVVTLHALAFPSGSVEARLDAG